MLPLVHVVLWTVSVIALLVSAATDFRRRFIPNEMVLVVSLCGLALGLVSRPGAVWLSVLIAVGLLLTLGVLAHYKLIGSGDAKLIAAVTLLVPPERVVPVVLAIALAGGVLSCVYLVANIALRAMPASVGTAKTALRPSRLHRLLRAERARITSGRSVPYGCAILAGVGVYVTGELVQCSYAISCSL